MVSSQARGPAFQRIGVIGRGRVGAAIAARLHERGVDVLGPGDLAPHDAKSPRAAELVLLCVPDGAIAQVARSVPPGPWIAHVSGATPLSALDPHVHRFSMHPLQTFTKDRGAEQLDGAWAAVTAASADAAACGRWLAECLGLTPFPLADDRRALYHAGAVIASNYLVGLHRSAARLFGEANAPSEALVPLMRRTIDNGFQLTGPIARGDWAVVEAHLAEIRAKVPELEGMYRALAAVIAS